MRSSRVIAAVVLAFLGGGWAAAANRPDQGHSRPPLSPAPRPASPTHSQPRPAAPPPHTRGAVAARNPNQSNAHHDADRHHDGRPGRHSHARPGVYAFYDNPCYGWYYPYCYYGYWPSWESFGLGPATSDASQPGGIDDAQQPWPDGGAAVAEPPFADPPQAKARPDRTNNARQEELAAKYIDYGDALFAKEKYVEANERYRKAARSAPQLAAAWFRQGLALAAIGRYDQAAADLKRGLKLDPAWPKSNFSLDQLFGGNAAAKNGRLDALAAAVKEKPADRDRLFLLGVFLHLDGQPNQAATIFARAEKLAGNNIGHIEAFMDEKE
jgi:hypothetical protein